MLLIGESVVWLVFLLLSLMSSHSSSRLLAAMRCRCLLRRSAAGSATDADGGMTGVAFFSLALFALAG